MAYKFRAVLSGPCAYVPNTIVGSGNVATSWSAVMPQLNIGKTVGKIPISAHFTVIQYPTALFDADFQPDLVFQRRGAPEFGIALLSRERIRIQTTENPAFAPTLCGLSDTELAAGGLPNNNTCLDWIPSMERLVTGAGTFGRNDVDLFDSLTGFPSPDIAVHTLLDHGDLIADSLVPKDYVPPMTTPPIWGFRVDPNNPSKALQSVAYTVAVELNGLSNPVQIVIESGSGSGPRTLTLKAVPPSSPVEIEIKNREFDEIVRMGVAPIENLGDVDFDFEALYFFSQKETNPTPLPFLSKAGSIGTRRATCGGAAFQGFDSSLAAAMAKW